MMYTRIFILVLCTLFGGDECDRNEMEDFPLDTEDELQTNEQTTDLSGGFETNEGNTNESNDKLDISELVSSKKRAGLFNEIMKLAMEKPGAKQRLAQVMPIIRSMSPSQRLTLATLVLQQLTAKSEQPYQFPFDQNDNKTAELMLPISVDIASIFHGLGKEAQMGRSTGFGTYYYNPLSPGYRVSAPPRPPPLFNVRRFQFTNSRRKDDVPPEMMPPPLTSSTNDSYANFNKQRFDSQESATGDNGDEEEVDVDDDDDDEEAEEDNNVYKRYNTTRTISAKLDCMPFINNICLDVNFYPSKEIANSIKNLQQKHVFRALVDDFANNVTVDNPEIERRHGADDDKETNMQLCTSKIKYARPKKARSMNGNWKFVVNTEHYTQTVRIETCLNVDRACSFLNDNVKSHCTQIYNYHRLLTWDEKSGLSLDLFKIPTCCACQLQHVPLPSFANTKHSQKLDIGLQENVIADESAIFHAPVSKPKTKNKVNVSYNPKRESITRQRRPPILPLHLEGAEFSPPTRYAPTENANRRTSGKTNILKGVYIPTKDTFNDKIEYESSTTGHRINYNYHPIIDFFRSTPTEYIDRSDTADEWLPMTEGPRSMVK